MTTIRHHPPDVMLAAYAAGILDAGETRVLATHVGGCPQCGAFVRAIEHVGGQMLEALPPTAMTNGALAAALKGLDAPMPPPRPARAASDLDAIPGLPESVRRCRSGDWKWVGPGVHMRPIILPGAVGTRLFLLKAASGTQVPQHSHTGLEMTCVLVGAFRHEGGRFGPGDFDFGDAETEHRPCVEEGEACICLVAMHGDIRLSGWLGRLVQPFARLF